VTPAASARKRQPPGYYDGLYGRRMLRALAHFTVDGGTDGECWDWVGAYTGVKGGGLVAYPALSMTVGGKRRVLKAHRVSYEAAFGPLPPGETVHHRCGRRRCIRPEHLQAASTRENVAEMLTRRALEARIASLEAALRGFRPDHPALEDPTRR
jgi:hypothetical protein